MSMMVEGPSNRTRGILATLAARFAFDAPVETPTKPSGGIPFAARHRQERKAERQNRLRGRRQQRG